MCRYVMLIVKSTCIYQYVSIQMRTCSIAHNQCEEHVILLLTNLIFYANIILKFLLETMLHFLFYFQQIFLISFSSIKEFAI